MVQRNINSLRRGICGLIRSAGMVRENSDQADLLGENVAEQSRRNYALWLADPNRQLHEQVKTDPRICPGCMLDRDRCMCKSNKY